jgi:hypothetical protein
MELTLASALSQEGLLGHAAYVLLVISMLMRTLLWLRILVIASAVLGISYSALILGDPVSTFWETCLVVVNVAQLLLANWRNLRARFSDDERTLLGRHLPGLSRGEARALLDSGTWHRLEDGASMTTEGVAVEPPELPRAGCGVGGGRRRLRVPLPRGRFHRRDDGAHGPSGHGHRPGRRANASSGGSRPVGCAASCGHGRRWNARWTRPSPGTTARRSCR